MGDSQTGTPAAGGQQPSASATLEQCVAGSAQSERSAIFAGEMTSMPGSLRMAIRIEIQEQMSGEAPFHTVTASGLGAWRAYVDQLRTLAADAASDQVRKAAMLQLDVAEAVVETLAQQREEVVLSEKSAAHYH